MKTLIKTYYQEPKVDSRILRQVLEKKLEKYSIDLFLLPIVGIGILALAFASFLSGVNRELLSVVINLYTVIGWVWLLVLNALVGTLYFIARYWDVIVSFLTLLLVGQACILGLHSVRKTSLKS
jgi:hypothetical protein